MWLDWIYAGQESTSMDKARPKNGWYQAAKTNPLWSASSEPQDKGKPDKAV